jgi:hypothetical protein
MVKFFMVAGALIILSGILIKIKHDIYKDGFTACQAEYMKAEKVEAGKITNIEGKQNEIRNNFINDDDFIERLQRGQFGRIAK